MPDSGFFDEQSAERIARVVLKEEARIPTINPFRPPPVDAWDNSMPPAQVVRVTSGTLTNIPGSNPVVQAYPGKVQSVPASATAPGNTDYLPRPADLGNCWAVGLNGETLTPGKYRAIRSGNAADGNPFFVLESAAAADVEASYSQAGDISITVSPQYLGRGQKYFAAGIFFEGSGTPHTNDPGLANVIGSSIYEPRPLALIHNDLNGTLAQLWIGSLSVGLKQDPGLPNFLVNIFGNMSCTNISCQTVTASGNVNAGGFSTNDGGVTFHTGGQVGAPSFASGVQMGVLIVGGSAGQTGRIFVFSGGSFVEGATEDVVAGSVTLHFKAGIYTGHS